MKELLVRTEQRRIDIVEERVSGVRVGRVTEQAYRFETRDGVACEQNGGVWVEQSDV
jgi:hypothetical protein